MAKYKVNGFLFETQEEAQKAKKELDAIRYIRSQSKLNDPEVILKLYDRLIAQNYFQTAVGIEFLRELQLHLESVPYVKKEDIVPIPIPDSAVEKEKEQRTAQHEARKKQLSEKKMLAEKKAAGELRYRRLFHETGILCVVLLAIVVGMFVITYLSGSNRNAYNYEQQIIDKYEAWETELSQREEELSQREKALDNAADSEASESAE